jgi:hypothetical protein
MRNQARHISPLLQATLIRATFLYYRLVFHVIWLRCRFHESHNKNVKCRKKKKERICSVMEPLSAESEAISMHLSLVV